MTYLERLEAALGQSPTGGQTAQPPAAQPTQPAAAQPMPAQPTQAQTGFDPRMLAEVQQGAQPAAAPAQEAVTAQVPTARSMMQQPAAKPTEQLEAPSPVVDVLESLGARTREGFGALYEVARSVGPTSAIKDATDLSEILLAEGPSEGVLMQIAGAPTPSGATDAGAGAAADWSALGTFDTVVALDAGLRAYGSGGDFIEAYSDTKEEVNAALAEDRAEHPIATTIGGVGGALMTGGPAGMAVNAAAQATKVTASLARSFAGRTFLVAAPTASAEAGLYRMNSDGTSEEIKQDMTLGYVGGALFAGLAGAAGSLFRRISAGKDSSPYEQLAADELLKAVRNADEVGAPAAALDPRALRDRIVKDGANVVMADVYPEIAAFIPRTLEGLDSNAGKSRLINLLRTRNQVEVDFPTAVMDAVTVPRVRSKADFGRFIRARQNRLQPRYDRALGALDQQNIAFKPKTIADGIMQRVRAADPTNPKVNKNVSQVLNRALTNATDKNGRVSARSLHNSRRAIFQAIKTNKRKNSPTGGLQTAYDSITEVLAQHSPEYAKLNRTYGRAAQQQQAYDHGYRMFGEKARSSAADFEQYTANANTYADHTAFVHGVRRRLYEDLQTRAANPNTVRTYLIDNKVTLDNLRAAVGTENTDAIVDSVLTAIARDKTATNITKANVNRAEIGAMGDSAPKQSIIDLALSVLPGMNSPAGIRARARFFGAGPRTEAQREGQQELLGRALTTDAADQPALMKELELIRDGRTGSPLTGRATNVAVGGMAAEQQNRQREVDALTAAEQSASDFYGSLMGTPPLK